MPNPNDFNKSPQSKRLEDPEIQDLVNSLELDPALFHQWSLAKNELALFIAQDILKSKKTGQNIENEIKDLGVLMIKDSIDEPDLSKETKASISDFSDRTEEVLGYFTSMLKEIELSPLEITDLVEQYYRILLGRVKEQLAIAHKMLSDKDKK